MTRVCRRTGCATVFPVLPRARKRRFCSKNCSITSRGVISVRRSTYEKLQAIGRRSEQSRTKLIDAWLDAAGAPR